MGTRGSCVKFVQKYNKDITRFTCTKSRIETAEHIQNTCEHRPGVSLRKKCPNTELFLVRIWTIFTHCLFC